MNQSLILRRMKNTPATIQTLSPEWPNGNHTVAVAVEFELSSERRELRKIAVRAFGTKRERHTTRKILFVVLVSEMGLKESLVKTRQADRPTCAKRVQ